MLKAFNILIFGCHTIRCDELVNRSNNNNVYKYIKQNKAQNKKGQ